MGCGWDTQMVKYLNSFNHNWALVFLNKTTILLQYNSAQIEIFTIQNNTIHKLGNCQQFNTIRAPHNCIAIQFTLNWPTLLDTIDICCAKIGDVYPKHFKTSITPKLDELIFVVPQFSRKWNSQTKCT